MIADGSADYGGTRDEAPQALDRAAAAVSADWSCVGQWQVDRLCAEAGPVTAAEARAALQRHGVRVAELPELPAQPPAAITRHPDFTDLVIGLGRSLSIELVFGTAIMDGFSLLDPAGLRPAGLRLADGRRLDREAIKEARRQIPAGAAHDGRRRVLSILADAAREPEALDAIVFWEVAERLRKWARDGGYSQRVLANLAAGLPLERGQAEILAAAVAEEHAIHAKREIPEPAAVPETEPPAPAADPMLSADPRGESDASGRTAAGPAPPAAAHPGTDHRDADVFARRAAGVAEVVGQIAVGGLAATRFGAEVRLTWIWPDEAVAAYVTWQPSTAGEDQRDPPSDRQQRRCSRRAYQAEGGFAAEMGHAAQRVQVRAVIAGYGEEQKTAPAEIDVPGIGIPVRYDFRRVPGLASRLGHLARRSRRRELWLTTELPCVLPDLIVVESRRTAEPQYPHDGEMVAKISGRSIGPGTPARVPVRLGGEGPSWIACFTDPAEPAESRNRVTLIGPPVGRKRVR